MSNLKDYFSAAWKLKTTTTTKQQQRFKERMEEISDKNEWVSEKGNEPSRRKIMNTSYVHTHTRTKPQNKQSLPENCDRRANGARHVKSCIFSYCYCMCTMCLEGLNLIHLFVSYDNTWSAISRDFQFTDLIFSSFKPISHNILLLWPIPDGHERFLGFKHTHKHTKRYAVCMLSAFPKNFPYKGRLFTLTLIEIHSISIYINKGVGVNKTRYRMECHVCFVLFWLSINSKKDVNVKSGR